MCVEQFGSVPAGAVSLGLLCITIPRNFANHGLPKSSPLVIPLKQRFSRAQIRRVDFLGTALLLCATTLLVTALEEANVQYEWSSGFIIAILILSALSWIAFLAWFKFITRSEGVREPIFPWEVYGESLFGLGC